MYVKKFGGELNSENIQYRDFLVAFAYYKACFVIS